MLVLAFSCMKQGEHEDCISCPELMTCVNQVCECDTSLSTAFLNTCWPRRSGRYISIDSTQPYNFDELVLDFRESLPSGYDNYRVYMFFSPNISIENTPEVDVWGIRFEKTNLGYDSVYGGNTYGVINVNNEKALFQFSGVRYADSMLLDVTLYNTITQMDLDTLSLRLYNYE